MTKDESAGQGAPAASASDHADGRPVSRVGVARTIREFAFFPLHRPEFISDGAERGRVAWGDVLQSLADLAEPEDWTGQSDLSRPLPILDSYLPYTYQRLVLENKIVESSDGEMAALNTGLLTAHAGDIFGLFTKNRQGAQPWVFYKWAVESDRILLRSLPDAPQMAEYVSTSAELVYDWRRPLKPRVRAHTR